jgi:hypothetical protein
MVPLSRHLSMGFHLIGRKVAKSRLGEKQTLPTSSRHRPGPNHVPVAPAARPLDDSRGGRARVQQPHFGHC